jgi:phosphatidylglycerol:prolipoprotein diacylglycerol transferase
MISYIIWNGSPEIFSIGSFALRWYGLLFALGFLFSQQVLYYIYRREGKPTADVDTLTIYMVIATVVSARLGHVFFYQPEMLLKDPLGVFLPFEFHPFRFTGYQGLASHGAAFGILFALWLYSRKKKPGQNYLQVLDRIVIVVALTGAMIRLGNFFNSEIIGKPYNGPLSVVFMNLVTEPLLENGKQSIQSIEIRKDEKTPDGANGRVGIDLYVFFKPGVKEQKARAFIYNDVRASFSRAAEFIDEPVSGQMNYELAPDSDGNYAAKVTVKAISRHPAQLYESISCVLLFLLLFWIWTHRKEKTPEGRIFGVFMIVLWSLRFSYEFLKENQVPFENGLTLNMGQILSIPLVVAGIFVLIRSFKIQEPGTTHQLQG